VQMIAEFEGALEMHPTCLMMVGVTLALKNA
jgi:hypothetical protein